MKTKNRARKPKATKQRKRARALRSLPRSAVRAQNLIELSADWYWEQDKEFRFTRVESQGVAEGEGADGEDILGKRRWEIGLEIKTPGGWPVHRALLDEHQPFRDVVLYRTLADGTSRYVSVSGAAMFDRDNRFLGYRGIGKDITEQKQREEELLRFRAAIDASPDMVYLTDPATIRFLYVNEAACRIAGYTHEEHLKIGPQDVLMVSREELSRLYEKVIAAGEAGTLTEMRGRKKDGLQTIVEVRRRALRSGDKWMIVSISRDISQRIRSERAIRRLGSMFAALSETNEAIMHAKSSEELYQRVCDAAVHGGKFITAAILTPSVDSIGLRIGAISGPNERQLRDAHISVDEATPEGRGLVGTAFRALAPCISEDFLKDERTRPWHGLFANTGIKTAAAVPLVRAGRAIGVLLLYSGEKRGFDEEVVKLLQRMTANIAFALDNFDLEVERRRAEERIQYLATHDGLTGLPNRVMFGQVLNLAIESARRYERKFAVFFIDLDRFKVINDTLGHEAGDKLLQEMSARFSQCLRASDVVARLGGDEFVVLVQEVNEPNQVATVARKILSAAIKPALILGQECRVTASVGISMYPADAADEQTLMKNADMAMYLAKEEGKNNFQFYSKEIKTQSLERMTLEVNLRHALERNELSLHYQAKLDLNTGRISGVEALLRWDSPELGSVTPTQLIPVAEETGLIVPIGRWVLQTACAQNVAWQREGLPPVCIAVNLSPRQFADADLLADIATVLKETGLAPELLELEITESMVMHNTERAVKLLTAIKQLGVRLAIDDFGTGYSSLAQLKRFPIDTLKVDRSFIREIPNDSEDRAITEAIIAMGKSLSLSIVAEGVETEQQQAFLREHACDQMQGFYFSKPVPPEHFAELLRTHKPVARE
jgi:diguanylate cyclase (GGDEF)-like protein/PAS domain S-box-containing protein